MTNGGFATTQIEKVHYCKEYKLIRNIACTDCMDLIAYAHVYYSLMFNNVILHMLKFVIHLCV